PIDDYRSRLLFGSGMFVGLRIDGTLQIGRFLRQKSDTLGEILASGRLIGLTCSMTPNADGKTYTVTLSVQEKGTIAGKPLPPIRVEEKKVPAELLIGNVGLASKVSGKNEKGLIAFSDWTCRGKKFDVSPDQAFGPILWTMYTLNDRSMRMTAQMPIIGQDDSQTCALEVENAEGWKPVATAPIERLSRTATFTVKDWDDTKDTNYRVVWVQKFTDGTSKTYYWSGQIRRDPVDKPEITVAGFCCFADFLFPNKNTAEQVARQDPDIMFFMGDQIYEAVGGWGILRKGDLDIMFTNYLRKLALLGWSFRNVMRDRPTIWMPDDHDVYHGNVWGAGGRKITLEEWSSQSGYGNSRSYGGHGGYVQPIEWVKAVERTQTSHLPDPAGREKLLQGLTTYYTSFDYGRIGFAVLEDRKFKTGPMSVLPKHNSERPDWIVDSKAALAADVPEAELLGKRQLEFLTDWAKDWKGQDMKMVVSQSVFANAATHHGSSDNFLVADLDSNGWPQTGRNQTVDAIRQGHAFMLGGDQHLPTLIRHGIDKPGDAGISFVVPPGANIYRRWWMPEQIDSMTCLSKRHDDRPNTGLYREGFGNLIDVLAVSNPEPKGRPKLRRKYGHHRVSGWGIVRMNRKQGTATAEAWYCDGDISRPQEGLMPGWPQTYNVAELGGNSNPTLPPVTISDKIAALPYRPVVQVTDAKGHVVSTARMQGKSWKPIVFDPKAGPFTVTLTIPEEGDRVIKRYTDVKVEQ
ncbi:MAG: alkaline phosphatase D family protein, partial [Planctomycetia bacterium]